MNGSQRPARVATHAHGAMPTAEARAIRAALLIGVWYPAHYWADHIGHNSNDALTKGERSAAGRAACARHAAEQTATKLLALAVAGAATGIRWNPRRVAVALAADGLVHYVTDRREPLRKLCAWIGKTEFYEGGDEKAAPVGVGRYVLDQSVHIVSLAVTALYAAR